MMQNIWSVCIVRAGDDLYTTIEHHILEESDHVLPKVSGKLLHTIQCT